MSLLAETSSPVGEHRRDLVQTGSSEPTGQVMDDGGWVALESAIGMETRRELIKMGHHIQDAVGGFGGYQAIGYDAKHDVYIGASESRKDGQAAGY